MKAYSGRGGNAQRILQVGAKCSEKSALRFGRLNPKIKPPNSGFNGHQRLSESGGEERHSCHCMKSNPGRPAYSHSLY